MIHTFLQGSKGQTHFAPEIFKMSFSVTMQPNVLIFSPVMANNHNISEMQKILMKSKK